MIRNQRLEKESILSAQHWNMLKGKPVKHKDSQIANNFPEGGSEISPEAALIVSMSALQEKSLK